MTTTDTALAAESNSADMTPEWMRSLLNRQRTAFAQEGAPAYETRIDRTNRLIALLVDNQDEIVRAVNADYGHRSTEAHAARRRLEHHRQLQVHEAPLTRMDADGDSRGDVSRRGGPRRVPAKGSRRSGEPRGISLGGLHLLPLAMSLRLATVAC
jgi:hypothetical protein